ncbi:MAG: hypothetical protein L0H84_17380, partial [Pseudonocardia sp.]|nr:hypothetical protein [Pseudonocardia sp.]
MTGPEPVLEQARAAVDAGRWHEGLDLLTAPRAPTGPEALDLLGRAAYGAGRLELSIKCREQLYQVHLADGRTLAAAEAAATVALQLLIDTALLAPVRGWLARAQDLLTGTETGPVHALAAAVRGYERFLSGDLATARTQARQAVQLGEAHHQPLAAMFARVASARITIADGAIVDGLAELDEIAARLMGGEADPLTTGMLYCELVCAAQNLGDHARAVQWHEVMQRWAASDGIGSVGGRCRIHHVELLRLSGPADAAEAAAVQACEELRPWMRREFGWPLVELAQVRLRRGDLEGAEEAFLAALDHGWVVQPGLALLFLALGDSETAAAMIDDALAHPVVVPSKEWPPTDELRLVPLLDAQAEIAFTRDDEPTATAAAAALARIAGSGASTVLLARAALAEARSRLLRGELVDAATACSDAIGLWTDIGAPYETGSARMVLARVQHARGQHELARVTREAAERGLRGYGAATPPEVTAEHAAPVEEHDAVFLAEGTLRRVAFAGRQAMLPDLTGLRHVERLLAEPGREFHVLDLRGAGLRDAAPLPQLDAEARAAYRRRLREVEDDLAEAEANNDTARAELAQRDRDYLVCELTRAVGLGGRDRGIGTPQERARTSITRSIRYALARLRAVHPELASHLDRTI